MRYNKIVIVILSAVLAVSSCACAAEEEFELSAVLSDSKLNSNERITKNNNFYITVKDYRGKKKVIYVIFDEYGAGAFMDKSFSTAGIKGYAPATSEDSPANLTEVEFEDICGIIEKKNLYEFSAGWMIGYDSYSGTYGLDNEDDTEKIKDLLTNFRPEYVDIEADLPDGEEYFPERPLTDISFSDGRYVLSTKINIVFCNVKGKAYGKLVFMDYSALNELLDSGEDITKKSVKAAYGKSSYAETDWFLADGTELYNYITESILLNRRNNFPNVNWYEKKSGYDEKNFSPALKSEHIPLIMKKKPSVYSSEDRRLVGAYSPDLAYNCIDEYAAEQFLVRYYTIDMDAFYETAGRGYTLEKLASDGKWHEVLTSTKVSFVKEKSEDIPHAFSSSRSEIVFNPCVYPPLPAGKYRIVRTFREKGSSSGKLHGGFYEFDVCRSTDQVKAEDTEFYIHEYNGGKYIEFTLKYSQMPYWICDNYDIQKNDCNKWHSVRKTPYITDSKKEVYSKKKSGTEYMINTENFDLSEKGLYRICVYSAYGDNFDPDDFNRAHLEIHYGEFNVS